VQQRNPTSGGFQLPLDNETAYNTIQTDFQQPQFVNFDKSKVESELSQKKIEFKINPSLVEEEKKFRSLDDTIFQEKAKEVPPAPAQVQKHSSPQISKLTTKSKQAKATRKAVEEQQMSMETAAPPIIMKQKARK
jgi:hypothetical protein